MPFLRRKRIFSGAQKQSEKQTRNREKPKLFPKPANNSQFVGRMLGDGV
jgi:hypothetical protein